MARRKATVLLVDDSAVIRSALSRCINRCNDLVVINTASNGRIGVEMVRTLDPDIVVLDVEMPVMNGLEALAEIRISHPKLPVLMFSSLTEDGAGVTLEALALGASDYTLKPRAGGIAESVRMVERELLSKIRTLVWAGRPAVGDTSTTSSNTPTTVRPGAVVVGCSTGGPVAFERLLSAIATPLPVPIYVVQHMPPKYTRVFAERLDQMTATTVVEASDGINAQPGHCYVAPGGFHMGLRRTGGRVVIRIVDTPPIKSCKPSIEPLFMSADAAYGHNLVAVVLTGMGQDGLDGCRQISQNGGVVIAQDEETSAVWGIPGSVVRAGVATEVLPIERIGARVGALCVPRAVEPTAATRP